MTTKVIRVPVAYKPEPPQQLAHRTRARHTGYGGALGGGKSRWLIEECRLLCLEYAGNLGILGRYEFSDLEWSTYEQYLKSENWDLVQQHYQAKPPWIRYKNGSTILFRGLKDWEGLMSGEYGFIGIDQAEELDERAVVMLDTRVRLRLPNGDYPHFRMMYTFNPTFNWPKKWFIDRIDEATGQRYPEEDFPFIPAGPEDNPHLPEDYLENMAKTMPDLLFRRYATGNWDAIEGQALGEFHRDVHVVPPHDRWLEEGWDVYLGVDHGVTHPTVALWLAIDPETDELFFVQEYVQSGKTVTENAEAINLLTVGMNWSGGWIDPQTARKSATPDDTEWSVYKGYRDAGLWLALDHTKREHRLAAWKEALKLDMTKAHYLTGRFGAPRVYIFDTCTELIKCLPKLQYKVVGQDYREDVQKVADDPYDAGGFILSNIMDLTPSSKQRRGYPGIGMSR